MNFFAYYVSKASQFGKLPTDPASVPWLNNLTMLDGSGKPLGLSPPYSGTGIFRIRTSATMIVENQGKTTAKIRRVIGVDMPVSGAKPMYPYLGISHGSGDALTQYETLAAGEARSIYCFRYDVVDEALQSDQPIPTWPNWKVNGKPLLCLCANNDTASNPVIYRDVQLEIEQF